MAEPSRLGRESLGGSSPLSGTIFFRSRSVSEWTHFLGTVGVSSGMHSTSMRRRRLSCTFFSNFVIVYNYVDVAIGLLPDSVITISMIQAGVDYHEWQSGHP